MSIIYVDECYNYDSWKCRIIINKSIFNDRMWVVWDIEEIINIYNLIW